MHPYSFPIASLQPRTHPYERGATRRSRRYFEFGTRSTRNDPRSRRIDARSRP